MKCSDCNVRATVRDTRYYQNHKRRRWECPICFERFTSYEFIVTTVTRAKIGDILHKTVRRP
jgi:transcriptional regulator NrdR family protein